MANNGSRNLEDFMKYCQEHPEALERLKKLDLTTTKPVIGFAAELGFIFTEQDLAEYGKKALAQKNELSDEDLEQGSGGYLINRMAVGATVGVGLGAVVYSAGTAGLSIGSAAITAGSAAISTGVVGLIIK